MRDRPDISVIGTVDLADQPVGKYIFVLENFIGPRHAFYVDRVRVEDGTAIAERCLGTDNGTTLYRIVVQVPVQSPWAVILSDYMYISTYREALERKKKAADADGQMVKEIFGADAIVVASLPETSESPTNKPMSTEGYL